MKGCSLPCKIKCFAGVGRCPSFPLLVVILVVASLAPGSETRLLVVRLCLLAPNYR